MTTTANTPTGRHDAVVNGAGLAGLYMLFRLRQLGLSARVFEAGDGVGGTWYWNRYPGARCDVESMQYSYSFSEALQQQWQWSERYPRQEEILRYINHVADRFELRRDIALNTRVTGAARDAADRRWIVTTERGERVESRFLIAAAGCLSAARVPDIAGLGDFRGRWFHTGNWPHQTVDFSGQRVGVIGTGSSGIQIIPNIARQARALTVFQRTANFSIPAWNRPLPLDEQDAWKANYALHRKNARNTRAGILNQYGSRSAAAVDPAERQAEYERRWLRGGANFTHAFNDIYTNRQSNESAAEFVRGKIRQTVRDPRVALLLMPRDHAIGTKRICGDSDYFETFNLPHVRQVDLRTTPIEAILGDGVRTTAATHELDAIVFATGYFETYNRDNVTLVDLKKTPIGEVVADGIVAGTIHHKLDVLVCATGYDALSGAVLQIDIRGRAGRTLRAKWANGPRTYLGLMTAGFPNLFMITGAGSPSVLVNMIVGIEHHVEWICDCLAHLEQHGMATIEAGRAAEERWVAHVNDAANKTLLPLANSWFLGANIPGKPRVFMPYVARIGTYRNECQEVADHGYDGFILGRAG